MKSQMYSFFLNMVYKT